MPRLLSKPKGSGRARSVAGPLRPPKVERAAALPPPLLENGFWYDEACAERAVAFFPRFMVHTKGQWAGKPFHLEAWQAEIIRKVFGWKRPDGTRRYRTVYIEVPRKNGKALALDTPIPTPSGWTTMGELAAGDTVFDERGVPCRVVRAFPVEHQRPCYRVSFADGHSIVADAAHEWLVRSRKPEHHHGILETREIAASLLIDRQDGAREHNHHVAVAGALQTPDVDLPIDPYALGVWLGDGHSACAYLTLAAGKAGMVKELVSAGVELRESTKVPWRFLMRDGVGSAPGDFVRKLRALGVLNNKHIPAAYLRAGTMQRLALIQGLLDTDGSCSPRGQVTYSSMAPALRDGFMELARSLGYKPTLRTSRAKIDGRDVGEAYLVQFKAYADAPVFRLDRKRARLAERPEIRARSESRAITDVQSVPSVPVRCIEVDSPSHLYLAGEGMVPTHNSQMGSGLANYLLFADNEPGVEVYSAAADREQAAIVFEEAKSSVRASAGLSKRAKVFRRSIVNTKLAGSYKVLSSDAPTKHGLNPHGILFDELHTQPNRELWDTLVMGRGARRQPLVVAITTAGANRHSICWELHEYAKAVLKGTIKDDSFLAVIYAAGENDDWRQPETWRKANPNLGITVDEAYLASECAKAQHSPAYENNFKRYHLNIWTSQEKRWMPMDHWDASAGVVAPDELHGATCYGALDLSRSTDLTALVLCFPIEDPAGGARTFKLLPFFWMPDANLDEASRRDKVDYRSWVAQGLITATPGNVVDYQYIKAKLVALRDIYDLRELAYDRWGAVRLIQELKEKGFTDKELVPFAQGFSGMSAPMKELLTLVLSQRLHHGGNPVLRWMADNLAVNVNPTGDIMPNKATSVARIDGMVASIMALDRAIRNEGDTASGYEAHGIRRLGE